MSEKSLKRTQVFYKEKYGQEISEEEARQINRGITDYFRILARMKRNLEKKGSYQQRIE